MREKSFITTKILKNSRMSFGINNVPFTLFEKKNKSYSLTYQDNIYKFKISLIGNSFHFIEMSRLNRAKLKVWNREPLYIKYNHNNTYNVFVSINLKTIEIHDFKNGPLIIEKNYENRVAFHIEILINPMKKLEKSKKTQSNNHIANKKEMKEKRKSNTNKLIKKFNEFEAIYKKSHENKKSQFESKGIYITHPNAYKRCENCANFTISSKCSAHNLEVYDNHRCNHFYTYKTYLGGGFSPK